ncbi:hypothetical protein PoB_002132200 [Plakobranchus ocellatus]|uniref:Uncharacterized protein n=1 Tax=Plakobranchus ocellatus TaxID=259542 RepID=A0AAV3ZHL6_9GAST|nr:hypothetical protein PoB_002132200 [Plakobranchus ocellatus]
MIERSPSQDSSWFTVRYSTNIENLEVLVCLGENQPCTSDLTLREESIKSYSASFGAPHIFKEPSLFFETVNRAMELSLRNDKPHAATQIHGLRSLPTLVTKPSTEIVYNPGEDAVLTMNFDEYRRYDPEFKLPELELIPFFYDLTDRKVLENTSQIVETSYSYRWMRRNYLEKVGYKYTIKTSKLPIIGGYLMFQTTFPLTGPLVKEIWQAKILPLRPSNQSQPFGPKFFYIWTEEYERQILHCKYGDFCFIFCKGVGTNITSMEIRQESIDGTENIMQSRDCSKSGGFCPFTWSFKAERDMARVNGLVSFTCFAFDDVEKLEAKHTYNFQLVKSYDEVDDVE